MDICIDIILEKCFKRYYFIDMLLIYFIELLYIVFLDFLCLYYGER